MRWYTTPSIRRRPTRPTGVTERGDGPATRPVELARVDELLDDQAFVEPFREFFDPRIAGPSIPIECYLRLMFLKYRYRLGFGVLCREVCDSVSWSRFCRIPFGGAVPDPSTLKKIMSRCGPGAIEALNDAVLKKAADNKVLSTDRVRADTTVMLSS